MAKRLERLFDRYSADLRRFAPDLDDHFGCPLCLRGLRRVADLRDIVAEEHVVAEALGGRIVTLTCRQCNNIDGTNLDAHLIQRVRIEANEAPVKVRTRMGDAHMGAEMDGAPDEAEPIPIRVIESQSDPRQVEEVIRLLREGETEMKLEMNFGFNANRSLVALVRSAYLLMFRVFGYEYVLDPSAAAVREQLKTPIERTPVLNGIIWKMGETIPDDASLCVMFAPELTRSFFIILRLNEQKHLAGVTIPPPGDDGSGLYALLQRPEAQGAKQLHPVPIPNGFLPLVQVWRAVIEHHSQTGPPV